MVFSFFFVFLFFGFFCFSDNALLRVCSLCAVVITIAISGIAFCYFVFDIHKKAELDAAGFIRAEENDKRTQV